MRGEMTMTKEQEKWFKALKTVTDINVLIRTLDLTPQTQAEFWQKLLALLKSEETPIHWTNSDKGGPDDIQDEDIRTLFGFIMQEADLQDVTVPGPDPEPICSVLYTRIKELINNSNDSFWNESLYKLIEFFVNNIVNTENKTLIPLDGEEHSITVDTLKNADAGNNFPEDRGETTQWVIPWWNVDNQNYDEVRKCDEVLDILVNCKKMQYTNRPYSEGDSYLKKWIRLLMPQYGRRVEVEDLDRNFWVIAQTIAAISSYLFDEDSPLPKMFEGLLRETTEIWENIIYLWTEIAAISQDGDNEIQVITLPLQTRTNEHGRQYDYFDTDVSEDWYSYAPDDKGYVVINRGEHFDEEVEKRLDYLTEQYNGEDLCVLPYIRLNNYKHNYYAGEWYPGIYLYDSKQKSWTSYKIKEAPSDIVVEREKLIASAEVYQEPRYKVKINMPGIEQGIDRRYEVYRNDVLVETENYTLTATFNENGGTVTITFNDIPLEDNDRIKVTTWDEDERRLRTIQYTETKPWSDYYKHTGQSHYEIKTYSLPYSEATVSPAKEMFELISERSLDEYKPSDPYPIDTIYKMKWLYKGYDSYNNYYYARYGLNVFDMEIIDSKMELVFRKWKGTEDYTEIYQEDRFYIKIINQELPGIAFSQAIRAAQPYKPIQYGQPYITELFGKSQENDEIVATTPFAEYNMGELGWASLVGFAEAPNLTPDKTFQLYAKITYTLREMRGRTPKKFSFETTIGKNPNIFCITEKEWNSFSKEYQPEIKKKLILVDGDIERELTEADYQELGLESQEYYFEAKTFSQGRVVFILENTAETPHIDFRELVISPYYDTSWEEFGESKKRFGDKMYASKQVNGKLLWSYPFNLLPQTATDASRILMYGALRTEQLISCKKIAEEIKISRVDLSVKDASAETITGSERLLGTYELLNGVIEGGEENVKYFQYVSADAEDPTGLTFKKLNYKSLETNKDGYYMGEVPTWKEKTLSESKSDNLFNSIAHVIKVGSYLNANVPEFWTSLMVDNTHTLMKGNVTGHGGSGDLKFFLNDWTKYLPEYDKLGQTTRTLCFSEPPIAKSCTDVSEASLKKWGLIAVKNYLLKTNNLSQPCYVATAMGVTPWHGGNDGKVIYWDVGALCHLYHYIPSPISLEKTPTDDSYFKAYDIDAVEIDGETGVMTVEEGETPVEVGKIISCNLIKMYDSFCDSWEMSNGWVYKDGKWRQFQIVSGTDEKCVCVVINGGDPMDGGEVSYDVNFSKTFTGEVNYYDNRWAEYAKVDVFNPGAKVSYAPGITIDETGYSQSQTESGAGNIAACTGANVQITARTNQALNVHNTGFIKPTGSIDFMSIPEGTYEKGEPISPGVYDYTKGIYKNAVENNKYT